MALVEGILSAVVESDPTELGAMTKSKVRPIQLMSEREADEEAQHGEVLRWSPTVHYVTTGLIAVFHLCNRLFLTSCLLFLPSDDESKFPDVEEAKIQDVEETKTQEDNSSDDEEDNTPIAASIVIAPKGKRPATRKKKDKRQTWTYQPVVEGPATYWDGPAMSVM